MSDDFKKLRICALLLVFLLFQGCASSSATKIKDGALALVGLVPAESLSKAAAAPAKPTRVEVFAGRNLNADERQRPMAVVIKFYRLRDPAAFMQAPYELLADGQAEKGALASDVIEVKELVVTPGQEVVRQEMLAGDATYLGVVALFRKPHPDRWRLVFSGAEPANANGVVMGAHACAMTVSRGVPFNAQLVNAGSLGGVSCK
ncbi:MULTISPECIES: type VI secretion system lipoprotein TssJ [unclassified Uliginosibacterium]|uniref:type VI secretion system lipoprotein TssJ n=1 Tax=unclassified Uliginosibacterium TaxID=2621521 RepID=UPI000C7D493D|nr:MULTISPECIES: type VI secretion system lipoprotein TssJ [unclassified Uliginosibacterium]MDO6388424.1 type VI secretion system lipoprotein TssJ [Uliginosibacterium sp. 31-12]PLK47302.1 type VI secretion system lipoprotein TssJ [Uliginosibacterium sp. TH139]